MRLCILIHQQEKGSIQQHSEQQLGLGGPRGFWRFCSVGAVLIPFHCFNLFSMATWEEAAVRARLPLQLTLVLFSGVRNLSKPKNGIMSTFVFFASRCWGGVTFYTFSVPVSSSFVQNFALLRPCQVVFFVRWFGSSLSPLCVLYRVPFITFFYLLLQVKI